jgi:hypothetical protein
MIPKHNDHNIPKLNDPEVQQSRIATIPIPKSNNPDPRVQASKKRLSQRSAMNQICQMSTKIHVENIQLATIPMCKVQQFQSA